MSKWDEELSDTEQHSGFKQPPKEQCVHKKSTIHQLCKTKLIESDVCNLHNQDRYSQCNGPSDLSIFSCQQDRRKSTGAFSWRNTRGSSLSLWILAISAFQRCWRLGKIGKWAWDGDAWQERTLHEKTQARAVLKQLPWTEITLLGPLLTVDMPNCRLADFPVASQQPTSRRASRRDSLCYIYGFDLSFPSVPTTGTSLRFNFVEVGLCLVAAWAIPRALWVAPGGAARYNQISRAINNKPFQCSYGRNYPYRRWSESAAG